MTYLYDTFYKFLDAGGVSPFSGHAWSLPRDGHPGAWVESAAPLVPCRSGVHVCRERDLAWWVGPELYRVDVGGMVIEGYECLVAERARLVSRVEQWDQLATRLAAAAIERAATSASGDPLAAQYAGDARRFAAARDWGACLLCAACASIAPLHAAGVAAARELLASERAWQSAWLAEALRRHAEVLA